MLTNKDIFLVDLTGIANELESNGETILAEGFLNFAKRAATVFYLDETLDNAFEKVALSGDKELIKIAVDLDESLAKEAGVMNTLSKAWQVGKAALGAQGWMNQIIAGAIAAKGQMFVSSLNQTVAQKTKALGGKTLTVQDIQGILDQAVKTISPQFVQNIVNQVKQYIPPALLQKMQPAQAEGQQGSGQPGAVEQPAPAPAVAPAVAKV